MSLPLLPASALAPSISDGTLDTASERAYRVFGSELAAECGIQLSLPQVVIATAQVFFQRFLHRASLREHDAHCIVMGSLYLAGKVEESLVAMRPIVNVCFAAMQRRKGRGVRPPVLGGRLYQLWKQGLVKAERDILKELGFQVYQGVSQQHAHKFLLYFVRFLNGDGALAQAAWGILNDSLRLDLCLRHPPEVIACAAIALGARSTAFPLPQGSPWFQAFGASQEHLDGVCASIVELYGAEEPAGWLPSKRPDWKPQDEEDDELP
jgi:hypothetical protein